MRKEKETGPGALCEGKNAVCRCVKMKEKENENEEEEEEEDEDLKWRKNMTKHHDSLEQRDSIARRSGAKRMV